MRVAYCSDLHLEFKKLELNNDVGADVLVLAGDVCVAESIRRFPFYGNERKTGSHHEGHSLKFQHFFEHVSKQFPKVLYVAGNHEHYHGRFHKTNDSLVQAMKLIGDNIQVLDRSHVVIDGVTFIGATLWTDMDRGNEMTKYAVANGMSDFRVITYNNHGNYRNLHASDTIYEHVRDLDYIKHVSKQSEKVVVISHHAPSHLSIHEMYRGHSLNSGYCSDLSDVMIDRESIKFWIHGHVHNQFNYQIEQCNVLCNPRGYPDELPTPFKLLTFEV